MEAYEEAKESFNRLGPEIVAKKRIAAAEALAKAQETLNSLDRENISPQQLD